MTLNIAHARGLSPYQGFHSAKSIERNLNRIAYLLRRVDADLVALQEVDEDSHWNKRIHLLNVLQEASHYSHSYLGVHNRRAGRLPLAYGNGLLTKFPIRRAEHQAFGQALLVKRASSALNWRPIRASCPSLTFIWISDRVYAGSNKWKASSSF